MNEKNVVWFPGPTRDHGRMDALETMGHLLIQTQQAVSMLDQQVRGELETLRRKVRALEATGPGDRRRKRPR